jgi:hypothetical protein
MPKEKGLNMQSLFQDIRYGFRQLIKMPGFTLTAVVSLALGIGATTAVFSVVYAILMDPYPYKAPDRMIHMRLMTPTDDTRGFGVTGAQWQQLRKSPVVEDAFLEDDWSLTVTGDDLPEDVQGVYLTSNGFNFFGVPTALGRGLQPSDAIDGQDPQPVVVLSYKFWQRHFSSNPAVLGQTIQMVRKNYTVVGVAGRRFTWGDGDVYLPLKVTQDPVRGFYAGIRLKPGVSHAAADAALQPLITQFAKETPKHFPPDHLRLHVVGLNEDFVKQLGGTLYLLFGAVALLLMIGCGNVSILQLARATARSHEFAVRSAIGASRERAPYFEQLCDKVAEVPGVSLAAVSSNATPPSNGFSTKFEILGKPAMEDQSLRFNMVSPEYFPALRIPLVQGRIWDQAENHRGAPLIVINQSLSRRYFPNGDAIGHSLKVPEVTARPPFLLTAPGSEGWLLIVGVVADKRNDGLSKPILPEAFVPYTMAMTMYTQILVRSQVPPLTLLHAVRAKVNSIDHDQQTNGNVKDLEHWIMDEPEWARGCLVAWLFGAFAALAVVLAAVGLYSVVSYSVVQRTNEFGIRMTLGAPRGHVLRIVFGSTALSVGAGIVAGLVLSMALSKVMAHWAQESSRDPLLLAASTLTLALVAALACAIPARRAAGVDPMTAIRYE